MDGLTVVAGNRWPIPSFQPQRSVQLKLGHYSDNKMQK